MPKHCRILKFKLRQDGPLTGIPMQKFAQILTVQRQGENYCLWAKCDPEEPVISRTFRIIGTGISFDTSNLNYIGTFQDGQLVWHVFEVFNA